MIETNISPWIKIKSYNKEKYLATKILIDEHNLNTVCVEANCPNRYECFANKTATFIILGNICTRNCKYCNIKNGIPYSLDITEPKRIADAVKKLNLNYVVITCVTRDDLQDGGAEQFVNTMHEIKKLNPYCKIELLISDLQGNWQALKKILDAKPDMLNHNIEIVKDIFQELRPEGNYFTSLNLLKKVKEINPEIKTKSGFMVGLGENKEQIFQTLNDLKNVDCEIITVGQYLQPTENHAKLIKHYTSDEFLEIKNKAKHLGIKKIIAGPLVRSSYKAGECL